MMPKRNSPRKLKRRNRRRIHCTRCGSSYSYSGSRTHVCLDNSDDKISLDADDGLEAFSEDDICFSDVSETEDEAPTDCHEVIEGADAELDAPLSADLRRRLKDRLRKRFNEEDLSYFEDDEENGLSDETNGSDTGGDRHELVNEDWSGSPETHDSEEDFEHQLRENVHNDSLSFSDKCGVLVFWLLLFLVSWQSGFSVTDSAVEMLLKFLSRFFWLVGTFAENSLIAELAKRFPNTLYKLRKHLGLLNNDDFVKYVVCPKCKTLYDYKDCIQNRCGRQVSARCKFVPWSRHPHRNRRGKKLHVS